MNIQKQTSAILIFAVLVVCLVGGISFVGRRGFWPKTAKIVIIVPPPYVGSYGAKVDNSIKFDPNQVYIYDLTKPDFAVFPVHTHSSPQLPAHEKFDTEVDDHRIVDIIASDTRRSVMKTYDASIGIGTISKDDRVGMTVQVFKR